MTCKELAGSHPVLKTVPQTSRCDLRLRSARLYIVLILATVQ